MKVKCEEYQNVTGVDNALPGMKLTFESEEDKEKFLKLVELFSQEDSNESKS